MSSSSPPDVAPATRSSLADDLRTLSVAEGDTVMVHAAFRRVGTVLGGPDALVDALLDAVGPRGSVVSYQDWELGLDVWDDTGAVRSELRPHVPPYDPTTARPARDHGVLAATIGTRPGVRRSGNPGASVAALGARAEELTHDHPLDHGYGEGSPLARLVALGGRVLMVGAPLDTMTLLHHAEALADLPDKRRVRVEYPLAAADGGVAWRWAEELDTSRPVVAGLADDYFADVVAAFLDASTGTQDARRGRVGAADSVLVDAAAITSYAVTWLEERHRT
ncbi:aminoglycoside 3-N-acetyltransferase [Nocardioides alkalitolerans]|uniref:aminoglycoside 3-N-acetyltransferase n=1 Tax=Nocardioides alkalitolerans TaxID=281714 RepID=UPI00041D7A92|nr:aminoglycoside 3-N-acetyltransferase [Nocardioides alkalitolerans]